MLQVSRFTGVQLLQVSRFTGASLHRCSVAPGIPFHWCSVATGIPLHWCSVAPLHWCSDSTAVIPSSWLVARGSWLVACGSWRVVFPRTHVPTSPRSPLSSSAIQPLPWRIWRTQWPCWLPSSPTLPGSPISRTAHSISTPYHALHSLPYTTSCLSSIRGSRHLRFGAPDAEGNAVDAAVLAAFRTALGRHIFFVVSVTCTQ